MTEKKRALRKLPTSVDVARRAGVSQTTVSFVLNNIHNQHVSAETRAKVLQAVEELQYSSHTAAQALSKGYSEEICFVVNSLIEPFVAELIASIQQRSLFYGYSTVIYLSHGLSSDQKKELYQKIFSRHPIGVISTLDSIDLHERVFMQHPSVNHLFLIEALPQPLEDAYSLIWPSKMCGYLAAQHLLARSHRRLALVQPDEARYDISFTRRLEGMRSAIADVPGASIEPLSLHLSVASATALVNTRFSGPDFPTGIYAFNDDYALLLQGALAHQGLRVPQDVALVGTDNIPIGERVQPSLTSIAFDSIDLGRRGVDLLHLLHREEPLPEELTAPLIPVLIPRESS